VKHLFSAASFVAVTVGALQLAGCAATPSDFSTARARAHVEHLAGTLGTRPAGTDRNRAAREYVVAELRAAGFEVRVQEADAERPGLGVTARVRNVIAVAPGSRRTAVALMAHYDSVPDGPGAADDGLGMAVCLEAGRALAARRGRQHGLVVVATDGEELGLMGAAAVLRDPVAASLGAVLNFEAIGSAAPVMLFETGARSGALIETWARHAPRPAGASYMAEIYKAISPSGDRTDLGPFGRAGIAGLGFAAVGDGYTYHTPQDSPARLADAAIRQAGENAVAIVAALDAEGVAQGEVAVTTYFDLLGVRAFAYGVRGELILLGLAVVVGLIAWVHLLGVARRAVRPVNAWLSVPWAAGGAACSVAAMLGAAWLVRATSVSLHPWYAHPDRFFAWLLVAAVAAAWAVARAGWWLPQSARGTSHPAVVWIVALPLWIGLVVVVAANARTAAFLVEWPLLAAGVALLAFPVERAWGMRCASAVAATVAAAFWLPLSLTLLHFVVPELGRTPIVTPLFVYPALFAVVGLVLAPPVLALAWPAGRPSARVGLAWAALGVAVFAWCRSAPAYTAERPLRHVVRYVADLTTAAGTGGWEVAADEAVALPNGPWSAGSLAASTVVGRFRAPFLMHAAGPGAGPRLPVAVTGAVVRGAEVAIEVTVVPSEPGWTAAFVLPPDVVPLSTGSAMALREGHQVAVFESVPLEGVTFRARLEPADADRLPRMEVVASGPGLPGAAWPKLPAWLPQERDIWQARSYYVLPVEWH
jgi:hypothetical protein